MELPVIDWEISKKLAGNNLDHAKEYLSLLINELNKEIPLILNYQDKNELQARLHKLRGALSYSGLEKLKKTVVLLEHALSNQQCIHSLLNQLKKESEIICSTLTLYNN